jgi:hypothetical protein
MSTVFFWPFIMDLLQWNLNDFCMWFPDVQILTPYRDPTIIRLQETHLCPSYVLNLLGYVGHCL